MHFLEKLIKSIPQPNHVHMCSDEVKKFSFCKGNEKSMSTE